MNEFKEGFPGSNSPAIERLQTTGRKELFDEIKRTPFTDFYLGQRDQVYELINSSFGGDESELRDRAILHVATDAVEWVSERPFDKYPYMYLEEDSKVETHDRISTGLDLLQIFTRGKALRNKDIITDSLRLAFALDKSMDEVQVSPSLRYLPKQPPAITNQDPEASRYSAPDRQILLNAVGNCLVAARALYPEHVATMLDEATEGKTVESLLHLANHTAEQEDSIVVRQKLLDKAVEYTKSQASPTVFDQKLELLAKNVEDNLVDTLTLSPKHVKEVIELHDINAHEGIWTAFAHSLISIICTNMNKSSNDDLKTISYIQACFKEIAPHEVYKKVYYELDSWFHPYFSPMNDL